SRRYVISVENNSKKLVQLDVENPEDLAFNKVVPVMDGDSADGHKDVEKTFSVWQLTNVQDIPQDTATTTTTSTTTASTTAESSSSSSSSSTSGPTAEKPWYETELENCPIAVNKPCRGLDGQIGDSGFGVGNLLWIQLKMEVSKPLIEENGGRGYWMGYDLDRDSTQVLGIRLNETHIVLQDRLNGNREYSSPLTNSSLGYLGRELYIGLGWSRLGLFLVNEDHNSFIDRRERENYQFNKVRQVLSPTKKPSNYYLEENFLYPVNIMYQGYETCSLFSDCSRNTVHCGSQVLKEICNKRIPNIEWTFEGLNSETHVSNGTWGEEFKLDELMNVYLVSSGQEDLLGVYFFKNRLAFQDFKNSQSCSGAYPREKILGYGEKIKWSLSADSNNLIYLNYFDLDDHTKFTVCVLKYNPGFTNVEYIYPLGYSPSYLVMTQTKASFEYGGYAPSSFPNTGFYNPDRDLASGVYDPFDKYGESFPFYPPGVKPAPIDGDDSNTPPNYHYNSTTSQFEPNNANSTELNPFRPTHIVDGNSICDLYLFSTCNATSARIMPENTLFKSGWTLFVILSTGVPVRGDDAQASKSVIYNYRYNFIRTLAKGGAEDVSGAKTEEVVMSLSLSNETVVFRNEKANTEHLVGAPQCGPYCSTYPGGFFAFWLTYDSRSRKYVISVENNSKKLVELDAGNPQEVGFDKVVPVMDGNVANGQNSVSETFSVWQLTNVQDIPQDTATTTTTTTASTTSSSSSTAAKPWYEDDLENCPITVNRPCRGESAILEPAFGRGQLVWINGSVSLSDPLIDFEDGKYWFGYRLEDEAGEKVLSIYFNESFLTVVEWRQNLRYLSPYTNESFSYLGREENIAIGWSKMGLFILNEELNSLVEIQTDSDFGFKKIIQESNRPTPIKYILEEGFFYPNNILYIGYETCSLKNECRLESTSCNSQVLKDLCDKRMNQMSWTFETHLSETHVNNGTWSQDLEIPDLLGVYLINNGHLDIYIVYLFNNRIALKSLVLDLVCSGPYPGNPLKHVGDKITWSLSIGPNDLLYLNVIDDTDPNNIQYFTVCPIPYDNKFGRFKYIYPLGYAPSKATFVQDLSKFPIGGFDSTSSKLNGGFYFPDKNTTTNEL
ncbi:hypothetical protein OIY81_3712, partial [Cryptosporidium canis]